MGDECSGLESKSRAPQGSMLGPRLFFLFLNDLPDVLEALTLVFADDVKMVARRTQNMNLHSSLTAAWDWSKKWDQTIILAKCNYLTIGLELPRIVSFVPAPYP